MKLLKFALLVLSVLVITACKKSNAPLPVPAAITGHWTITETIFTYNYIGGGTNADTLISSNAYPFYEINADGSFSERDGDNSLIQFGNFAATQINSNFQITFNYNEGGTKNCNGILTASNKIVLFYSVSVPGSTNIASITTTQNLVKAP